MDRAAGSISGAVVLASRQTRKANTGTGFATAALATAAPKTTGNPDTPASSVRIRRTDVRMICGCAASISTNSATTTIPALLRTKRNETPVRSLGLAGVVRRVPKPLFQYLLTLHI